MYNRISAIDLNGLALFHQLASSASLRQAAARLGVPQATVSRKLRELERDLGAVLFRRGPRRLSLTEAGKILLEHSEHIIPDVNEACNAVAEVQLEPRGTIRVSLPFGFGTDLASSVIAKFALAHPQVDLRISATHRPVDVTTELIDVALNVGPVLNESLPAVKLSELHRGVYGSTRYCERQGVPAKPADLARFECITLEAQRASGLWSFGTGRRRSPVHSRIQVTDVATAFQMVCADLGFAILPNILCIEAVRTGKVRRVLQGWRIPPLPVTATYLDRRNLPLRIRAFLDFIRDELRPLTRLP